MGNKARLFGFLVALGAAAVSAATNAAERVLFRLDSGTGAQTLREAVLEKAGLQLANAPSARATWTLAPGDPLRTDQRPSDRLIELYTGTPQTPSLLCRVVLRYYAAKSGWVPRFQLQDEPALARVEGRWQPVEIARGAPALLVQHGNAMPNADGFLPTVEIGLTTGPLTIVAWQVR